MSESTRIGVIGVGKMGQYHVGALWEMRDVELALISDPDEERGKMVSERYDVPYCKNYKDTFDKLDAAIIAVPTKLHYPIAKEFLEKGIHVLLEKPCADNMKEAQELFKIAKKHDATLHIGHVERFNGAVQELGKLVDEPIYVECKRMGPFVERMKSDGVVLDIMIHDIDIVLNLMQSKVTRMQVMGKTVFSKIDDLVSVQLQFENGCMASIVASRASQNKVRTLSITQKESYVLLDYTDQEIYVHRQSSSEHVLTKDSLRYKQESLVERIFIHKENPLKLEIKHFLDCVRNGTTRLVAVDKELYSLQISLEIVEALKQANAAG